MMTFLLKQEALLSEILAFLLKAKVMAQIQSRSHLNFKILSPPAYGEVSYCNFLNVSHIFLS